MMGKIKCEFLKGIRKKIALENDIEYESRQCTFEGDCTGTCPQCEEELKYLEAEIAKKEKRIQKISDIDQIDEDILMGDLPVNGKYRDIELGMPVEVDYIEPLDGLPVPDDYLDDD